MSGFIRSVMTHPPRIVGHPAGQFSGESTVVSGRRATSQLRVSEAGEVIQIDRDRLLALIQTDVELSEILMGAFLQHRLGMIAADLGDVVVIGSGSTAVVFVHQMLRQ